MKTDWNETFRFDEEEAELAPHTVDPVKSKFIFRLSLVRLPYLNAIMQKAKIMR